MNYDKFVTIAGGDEIHIILQNAEKQQVAVLVGPEYPSVDGSPNMEDNAKLFITASRAMPEVHKLLDLMSCMKLSTIPLTVQRQMATVRKYIEQQKLPLAEFHRVNRE